MVDPPAHDRLAVALLKNRTFDGWSDHIGIPGALPYRIDYLDREDIDLRWSDAHPNGAFGRALAKLSPSVTQPCLLSEEIGTSPVALSVFEGEAHLLAAARLARLPRAWRRPKLAVISCWMAERVRHMGGWRLRALRSLYQQIDLLIVFSQNQTGIFEDKLGIPGRRIRAVPFGVDDELYRRREVQQEDFLLAVGTDIGRDWQTLLRAAPGFGRPLKVACHRSAIGGIRVPPSVELLGFIEPQRYLDLLGRAAAVVITTRDCAYPSGQSVLLEAMAMGKPCVVTHTPAMADYAFDGLNSLTAPVGDHVGIATAVRRLFSEPSLAERLGTRAAQDVAERFNARAMWRTISRLLHDLTERD